MHTKARSTFTRATVLALISLAALVAPIAAASGEGTWVPASSQAACSPASSGGSCPEGMTCSEWEVDGEVTAACCIPTESVGSSDPGACVLTE